MVEKASDSEEEIQQTGYLPYPSIKSYKSNMLRKIFNLNLSPEEPVYITEKIHGTNFQMALNVADQTIQLGKRNSEICKPFPRDIDPDTLVKSYHKYQTESFFPGAVMFVIKNQLQKANELFNHITETRKDALEIILFGELFGGYYDNNENKEEQKQEETIKQKQLQQQFPRIQLEIQYDEQPHFWLFDIVINRKYIQSEEFFQYCKAVGYPTVPLINTLRFDQVFDPINVKLIFKYEDFATNVPKLFGKETIKENNYAEGVVIKFQKKALKIKSEKFNEECAKPKPKQQKKQQEKQVKKITEVYQRLNFARLQNVMIKEGNDTTAQKAYELIMADVRKDLKEDNLLDEGLEQEIQQSEKQLMPKVQKMYENYLKNLKK